MAQAFAGFAGRPPLAARWGPAPASPPAPLAEPCKCAEPDGSADADLDTTAASLDDPDVAERRYLLELASLQGALRASQEQLFRSRQETEQRADSDERNKLQLAASREKSLRLERELQDMQAQLAAESELRTKEIAKAAQLLAAQDEVHDKHVQQLKQQLAASCEKWQTQLRAMGMEKKRLEEAAAATAAAAAAAAAAKLRRGAVRVGLRAEHRAPGLGGAARPHEPAAEAGRGRSLWHSCSLGRCWMSLCLKRWPVIREADLKLCRSERRSVR